MAQIKITKQISKNIKKYRTAHGFTQAKLAELIDMDKVSISCIETGEYNLSLKSLERFAEIFSVPIIDLLRENSSDIQSQAEHIADMLYDLAPEEREAIVRIVRDIVSISKRK